jgi:hypothetical protein
MASIAMMFYGGSINANDNVSVDKNDTEIWSDDPV